MFLGRLVAILLLEIVARSVLPEKRAEILVLPRIKLVTQVQDVRVMDNRT